MIVKETGEPRLVYCPVCGYDLRSLPETHRCPECGFHYDPDTIVEWDIQNNGILSGLETALATFGLGSGLVFPGSVIGAWGRVTGLLILCCFGGVFYLRYHERLNRGFLAMGRHGITSRTWRRARTIQWKDLQVKSFAPLTILERKGDELVKLRLPLSPFVRRSNGRTSLHDEFLYRWRAEQTAEQHGETEDS
jgi:hypothetical protein